jgi:hypothetical protein
VAVNINGLAPNFFGVMEVPLLVGRGFDARDHGTAPRVAIVNQRFAREQFGDEDPIGHGQLLCPRVCRSRRDGFRHPRRGPPCRPGFTGDRSAD